MLRRPSIRTMSLADLHEAAEGRLAKNPTRTANHAGPSTAGDELADREAAGVNAVASDAHVAHLLKSFRCPVQRGKQKVPDPGTLQTCPTPYDADALGHNGCILDADQPESIHAYLNMADKILFSSHQVAPDHEMGRLLAMASTCRAIARKHKDRQKHYERLDQRSQAVIAGRTARAMARESLADQSTAHARLLAEEVERLLPFAHKLVHDRSREAQARRRADTWTDFSNKITAFCYAMIKDMYPEVIASQNLRIDAELNQQNPQQARAKAVNEALERKGRHLRRDALAFTGT